MNNNEPIKIVFEFMPTKAGGIIPAGVKEKLQITCIDGMAILKFKDPIFTRKLKELDKDGRYLEQTQTFVSYYPNFTKKQVAEHLANLLKRIK